MYEEGINNATSKHRYISSGSYSPVNSFLEVVRFETQKKKKIFVPPS